MTHHRLLLILASAGGLLASADRAHACAAPPPSPMTAFPAAGAADVSPGSSIFVSFPGSLPAGLTVEANGQPVTLPAGQSLGTGPKGYWLRLPGPLAPSTSYVVRAPDNGATKELTRFTTAATSDRAPGTPARLEGLRLWRVHYPDRIGGGDCVFSEYEGYIDLPYQPGAVPGTPAAEVVNVVTLTPKTGGAAQTFVFTGSERLRLAWAFDMTNGRLGDVPPGGIPSAIHAAWKPALEPDREYCATLTLHGRNDAPAASETICAPVTNMKAISLPPPDGGVLDGGTSEESSGSCAVGHGGPSGSLGLVVVGLLLSRFRKRARR